MFCTGAILVMQLVTLSHPIEFNFIGVEPVIEARCEEMVVSKNSKPITNSIGRWHIKPKVIICPHSEVTYFRATKAMKYWENLGYKFSGLIKAPTFDTTCITENIYTNQILIDIPTQGFSFGKHIGTTKTWSSTQTKEIFKARIEIISGWGNIERVLEHEIGHALGWQDNIRGGHIMNGTWSLSGMSAQGLKYE